MTAARAPRRRRLVCHHEAGHAFVRWYFGHHTDRAVVLTDTQIRAGDWPVNRKGSMARNCQGVVEGYTIEPVFSRAYLTGATGLDDEQVRLMSILAEVGLIESHAGMTAEAVFTKTSVAGCMLAGGAKDMETMRSIMSGWFPSEHHRHLWLLTEQRASALVRSRLGSAAISRIAENLFETGEVDGDRISVICGDIFGSQPQFGCWNSHWPPTLAQLRGGFIPSDLRTAA